MGGWRLPSVYPEGRRFIVAALVCAVVAFLWTPIGGLVWPCLIIAGWLAAFFRDPERAVPDRPDVVVAPADGIVTRIAVAAVPGRDPQPGAVTPSDTLRITISPSLFDVHMHRVPIAGHVVRLASRMAESGPRRADAPPEDERLYVIERSDGVHVVVTQTARALGRWLTSFIKSGDIVAKGQRLGFARFLTTVDLYLPIGVTAQVAIGQRTVAGETIIGLLGDHPPLTATLQ